MQLKMYGYEIAQKLSKYSLHVYNNLQRIVSIDHIILFDHIIVHVTIVYIN